MQLNELEEICREVRRDIIESITAAKCGHPGGSLSCVELIAAAYFTQMRVDPQNPDDPDRDRFVLSKGHCAPAYYSVLSHMGFFPHEELLNLRKMHSILQGHPSKKTPGVDAATGSLGQGVSLAVGMALAAKYLGKDYHTYVVTGDGELQEGQVWEAFTAANHYGLDNLTVMIDWNGLQIDGTNDEVMSLGALADKLRAFGFQLIELKDGNNISDVADALNAPAEKGRPKCVLAHTVKGKGISFMENQVGWHGKAPSEEEKEAALKELEG